MVKQGSGKLKISVPIGYSGTTLIEGGTLEIAGGIDDNGTSLIDVQSGTAALKTTTVNKSNLNIITAASATFEIVNGAHTVGNISGNGTTVIDSGASLTVESIWQDTLTMGSGATLNIQAIPDGMQGGAITPVPEPSTVVFFAVAFIMFILVRAKTFRR